MMTPRQVFLVFASLCMDDIFDVRLTKQEMIDFALSCGSVSKNLPSLKSMLDELLDGQYSDDDLDRIWRRTNAGIVWVGGGMTRQFLELARARLREKIS